MKKFIAAAVLGLSLLACTAEQSEGATRGAVSQKSVEKRKPENITYFKDKEFGDDFRRMALFHSINTVEFARSPDDGSPMIMTLQSTEYGDKVWFLVAESTFDCDIICDISISFDGKDALDYSVWRQDDSRHAVNLLADRKAWNGYRDAQDDDVDIDDFNEFVLEQNALFIKKLKSAKTVTLDAAFTRHGNAQFEFDVKDLKW
ncbi:hypothetical protein B0181_11495 [Moraxella caviae]|uniref:Lipoprotein n=1 Tax=Moraxella caviae TaxID=34060 RepID=A0A1S9ZT93_9GAMM|nr:hypothetical protein [Moraxella caviae]OOR86739.1 hypothetical protein B0181_11495 [Moraxella caviae]STZ14036.1 Uncharacterised protein [Moraxella caviae]VEW12828.1 Uncharacterised protein [Moraxella caviae]